jgi:acetyl-CoA carboxylase biotin carboxyl carrier protein
MDYEKLIDLISHLDQSSLAYVDYETDEQHVILSKEVPNLNVQANQPAITEHANLVGQTSDEKIEPDTVMPVSEVEQTEEALGEAVESPMVGVVYLQPKPDEDAFVKVGDRVEQGDVICIVEAMKLMNEIQAPHAGVVTEILVENEEVVEYKQPLIRIEA